MRPAIPMAAQARFQTFWKSPRHGRRRPFLSYRAAPQVRPWKMNGQSARRGPLCPLARGPRARLRRLVGAVARRTEFLDGLAVEEAAPHGLRIQGRLLD